MSENSDALRDLYRRARCVFLDCDGIIFDSNAFKLDAMLSVLEGYPEEQREAMAVHWSANGGVSRHVKFRYFFEEIAEREPVEALANDAVQRFTAWSLAGYRRTEPRPESLALARDAGSERVFVVSGALESELEIIFREKGIKSFFAEVLGSPLVKRELMQRVMENTGCSPSEALLIGDGAGDFRACRALGVHFAFLAEFSDWSAAGGELAGVEGVSIHSTWVELLASLGISFADP